MAGRDKNHRNSSILFQIIGIRDQHAGRRKKIWFARSLRRGSFAHYYHGSGTIDSRGFTNVFYGN